MNPLKKILTAARAQELASLAADALAAKEPAPPSPPPSPPDPVPSKYVSGYEVAPGFTIMAIRMPSDANGRPGAIVFAPNLSAAERRQQRLYLSMWPEPKPSAKRPTDSDGGSSVP